MNSEKAMIVVKDMLNKKREEIFAIKDENERFLYMDNILRMAASFCEKPNTGFVLNRNTGEYEVYDSPIEIKNGFDVDICMSFVKMRESGDDIDKFISTVRFFMMEEETLEQALQKMREVTDFEEEVTFNEKMEQCVVEYLKRCTGVEFEYEPMKRRPNGWLKPKYFFEHFFEHVSNINFHSEI